MTKKRIAVIGCVGIPAKYGGFETFAEYLAKELADDFEITIYCSAGAYPEKRESYLGAKLKYIHLNANGIQSILYDIFSMLDACLHKADVLLILGVGGCLFLPVLRFFWYRKKIITNIDGLEWRRDKWSKSAKKFLKFSEVCAVRYSDCAVGDNKVITDYIKEEYKKDGVLIEYGSSHVNPVAPTRELQEKYPFTKEKYCFCVCRIEPENNIEMILEAFSRRNAVLAMAGNWNNSEYGRKLFERYSAYKNIHLLHPVYDGTEINYLRGNCHIYVHGHSCGGTNPSLIEAMALGRAIFACDVNFNRETTEGKAIYFSDAADLSEKIDTDEHVLEQVRIDMAEIAQRRYTWQRIAGLYRNLF